MANYSITRAMTLAEVFVTPSTGDITGQTIVFTVQSSGTVSVLPQYSLDSGTTWSNQIAGAYTVTNTTDTRTLAIVGGIVRLTITGTTASTVVVTITTSTTAESGVVTSTDVYRTAGLTSTQVSLADVKAQILRAYSVARLMTGRPCGTEQRTEYHWGNNKKSLFLHYSPVITLDALTIGTSSVTTSYVDVVQETGMIILESSAEIAKFTLPANETPQTSARNITVTYTWGYFDVPYWYNRLVECLAAIQILTQQMGGTFDDPTSYTIGDTSVSVGEPYMNIQRTIDNLNKEVRSIIMTYVKKAPAVF